MFLSVLFDFPDDAQHYVTPETLDKIIARLKETGVKRIYWQWYGDRDTGYFWDNFAPMTADSRNTLATAETMPHMGRAFVETARKHGIETAAVMRPLENGIWVTYSPYYRETREHPGLHQLGGDVMIASRFLMEHPNLRVKRKSWDNTASKELCKELCSIKLTKQNSIPTRITARDVEVYVSDTNAHYKRYEGGFVFSLSEEKAPRDVSVAGGVLDYKTRALTRAGDAVQVITLGGLRIRERYIVVAVQCGDCENPERLFVNTAVDAIKGFGENGEPLCMTAGNLYYKASDADPLSAGLNFDDGFGNRFAITLDPPGGKGYLGLCRGKNEYLPGTLCECEPEVRAYWMTQLEKCLDEGFDMVGNRIECHSAGADFPFDYGYNDCIKAEYFQRHGVCGEKDMEPDKIARLRGDAYTEQFIEGARRVRARGRKVFLTLNLEMLHKPIPLARHIAYPMNVEWQWERWLEEIRPDEINFRTYCYTPEFVLSDPQCLAMLERAKSFRVPLTYERYCYWDFAADFRRIRDEGDFAACTLYEVNDVVQSDGHGGISVVKPELLNELKNAILTSEIRK